jgi:Domain of unknown function (DUF4118)
MFVRNKFDTNAFVHRHVRPVDEARERCYTGLMVAFHDAFRQLGRARAAALAALALPPGVCAAVIPARTSLPNTDVALGLVVLIGALAMLGTRFAGWLAALGSALWFDFFLTVPYDSFSIHQHTDIQTAAILLIVGGAVTELAGVTRRRGRTVAVDEALLAVTQSTAELVARGESAEIVVDQVSVQLQAVLGLRGCAYESGRIGTHGPRLEPDGSLRWGKATWGMEQYGFPEAKVELPARYKGRAYGRFVLDPTPATAPSIHARRTAVVLADLAATAIAERTSGSRAEHVDQ